MTLMSSELIGIAVLGFFMKGLFNPVLTHITA